MRRASAARESCVERNAVERDAAALRPSRSREQPQQRRLAGAVGPEDADEAVGRNVQRDARSTAACDDARGR